MLFQATSMKIFINRTGGMFLGAQRKCSNVSKTRSAHVSRAEVFGEEVVGASASTAHNLMRIYCCSTVRSGRRIMIFFNFRWITLSPIKFFWLVAHVGIFLGRIFHLLAGADSGIDPWSMVRLFFQTQGPPVFQVQPQDLPGDIIKCLSSLLFSFLVSFCIGLFTTFLKNVFGMRSLNRPSLNWSNTNSRHNSYSGHGCSEHGLL